MRSNTLLVLAVVAITAGGAFYLPSFQNTTSKSAVAPDAASSSAAPTAPHDDTQTDALDILADYLGIDISAARFERRLQAAATNLTTCRTEPDSSDCRQANEAVDDLMALSFDSGAPITRRMLEEARSRRDFESVARVIVDLVGDGSGSPRLARFRTVDRVPAIVNELRRHAQHATGAGTTVRFLIASLPDYVDSQMRWDFDAMIGAVQSGANSVRYVIDRFYLPDWDPSRDPDTNPHKILRAHEDIPGVLLLRAHRAEADRPQTLLVILLVTETPTAGIHKRAFFNAVRLARTWNPRETIPLLGPMYSGTRESLADAIRAVNADTAFAPAQFNIVSGSATDVANKRFFTTDPNVISFRATVRPDSQLETVLRDYVRIQLRDGRVARFHESNTGWGLGTSSAKDRDAQQVSEIDIPFPLHVSRLQNLQETRPNTPPTPSRFLNLSFVEPQATDQLPVIAPKSTLPAVELTMAGVLDQLRRERVSAVFIEATDARDRLFLAHQLRSALPDVLLLTAEADQLYVHPSYLSDTHGMLVASAYPLFPATQLWNASPVRAERRMLFRSTSAQGVFNAAVLLIGGESAVDLLDYAPVGHACSENIPPVWISVVGRDGLWPIAQHCVADTSDYMVAPTSVAPRVTSARLIRPSIPAILTFIAITVWTLGLALEFLRRVAAVRAPSATASNPARRPKVRELRGRHWPILAKFDLSPDSERHRYLLAAFTTAALVDAFLFIVCADANWVSSAFRRSGATVFAIGGIVALVGAAANLFAMYRTARLAQVSFREHFDRPHHAVVSFLGAMAMTAFFAYLLEVSRQDEVSALLFVNRVVQPGNNVSPALPILSLAAAIHLWGLLNLRRLGMPREKRINHRLGLVQKLTSFDDRIDAIAPASPSAFMIAIAAGLLFWWFVWPRSHEGRAFDWLYWSASAVVYALVLTALFRLGQLWHDLRGVLRGLASHPMMAAFKRLPPGVFKSSITAQAPDLEDLRLLVHRCYQWDLSPQEHPTAGIASPLDVTARVREQPEFTNPEIRGVVSSQALPPDIRLSAATSEAPARTQARATIDTFHEELNGPAIAWSESRTWKSLKGAVESAATQLRPIWQTGGHVPPELKPLEESIAIAVGLSIREILARTANSALFVMVSLFLVLGSHTLFPFSARQMLLAVSWVFILAAMVVSLAVFVAMDRDNALSRMSRTVPGHLNWDSATVSRVIVYGVVPLGSLLAVQFPELAETIMRWIQPIQKGFP